VKRGSPGYPQNDVAIEDARAEREIAPLSSHRLEKFERLDNAALPAPRPRARGDPRKPIRRNLIDPPAALTRCHRYATYCSKQGEVPRSMHRRTRRSIGAARGEAAPLVRRFSSGVAYRANSLSLSLSSHLITAQVNRYSLDPRGTGRAGRAGEGIQPKAGYLHIYSIFTRVFT
jgi:hypothetical protein